MQAPQKIPATAGEHVRFGKSLGTRRMLPASATGATFGLVEHDLPARQLGSPVHTLGLWLNSPPHRANLLAGRWRDLGIAVRRGHMFGRDGVSLWVMQFGIRR